MGAPVFKPKPPRPILGVQMADAGTGGAVFAMVLPKGPAAEAGMLPKDVVIEFGGRPVKNADDLQHLLATATVGDTVEVTYMRGTEKRTTKVKIGGR